MDVGPGNIVLLDSGLGFHQHNFGFGSGMASVSLRLVRDIEE